MMDGIKVCGWVEGGVNIPACQCAEVGVPRARLHLLDARHLDEALLRCAAAELRCHGVLHRERRRKGGDEAKGDDLNTLIFINTPLKSLFSTLPEMKK